MLADAAADGRAAVGGGYATGSAEPCFVASGGERWRAVASASPVAASAIHSHWRSVARDHAGWTPCMARPAFVALRLADSAFPRRFADWRLVRSTVAPGLCAKWDRPARGRRRQRPRREPCPALSQLSGDPICRTDSTTAQHLGQCSSIGLPGIVGPVHALFHLHHHRSVRAIVPLRRRWRFDEEQSRAHRTTRSHAKPSTECSRVRGHRCFTSSDTTVFPSRVSNSRTIVVGQAEGWSLCRRLQPSRHCWRSLPPPLLVWRSCSNFPTAPRCGRMECLPK